MDNQDEEGIRATLRDHRVENGFKHQAKTYFSLIAVLFNAFHNYGV